MAPAPPPLPRTVILDYYDSYTNNLLTLFTRLYSNKEVLDKVVVVKADHHTWDEFREQVLPNIDCVILSPGPGRPDNPKDIGFALDLLREHAVPVLGVCLGHQAIGVAFGGKIAHAPVITHGQVVRVAPVQPPLGLFAAPTWDDEPIAESYEVVVYNSLIVDKHSLPEELEVTAWSSGEGERTIQGLRHKEHPIWGVQYHPESISSTRGTALLHAFLLEVHSHHSRPTSYPTLKEQIVSSCAYRVSAAGFTTNGRNTPLSAFPTPPGTPPMRHLSFPAQLAERHWKLAEKRLGDVGRDWATSDVFERLVRGKDAGLGHIWLDGQSASPSPSRPTISTLAVPSFLLTYSLATRTITLHRPRTSPVQLRIAEGNFWDQFSACQHDLADRLQKASSQARREKSKFRGGWVGWFGYEMKEESLAGHQPRRGVDFADWTEQDDVDACWAWVGDHLERTSEGEWIVKSVVAEDTPSPQPVSEGLLGWLEEQAVSFTSTTRHFEQIASDLVSTLSQPAAGPSHKVADKFPAFHPIITGAQHRDAIDQCREAIRQGESYELTLTTRFDATLPTISSTQDDTYSLYLKLRARNPAYYSTYISFPTLETPKGRGLHVISSSPERFLKIDEKREVEMMPIKGTLARVKPGQCVCTSETGCQGLDKGSAICNEEGRREDARRAEWLRNDRKERAENLMIVDLIRADLLSCCIPSTVKVPKLIALESYGVHHLVTTVTGILAENVGPVDAVKRCFPPGSMTGAPKLRSVQLLEEYESRRRRGIYSGALGYFSLDGATDLSVVIRTIVVEGDRMSIGSGGGITWLSNRDSEWEEVLTKVRSVVGELEDVQ